MKRATSRELAGTDSLRRDQRRTVAAALEMMAPPERRREARDLAARLSTTEKAKDMGELKELCGAWKRVSQSNRTYYSGKTTRDITIPAGSRVQVFENDTADDERKPALKIMWAEG